MRLRGGLPGNQSPIIPLQACGGRRHKGEGVIFPITKWRRSTDNDKKCSFLGRRTDALKFLFSSEAAAAHWSCDLKGLFCSELSGHKASEIFLPIYPVAVWGFPVDAALEWMFAHARKKYMNIHIHTHTHSLLHATKVMYKFFSLE